MTHFCNSLSHTFCDHLFAVLAATTQATVKLIFDGGRIKMLRAPGILTDLLSTLPVDIREDIDAGCQYLLDGFARGAVIVAKTSACSRMRLC